VSNKVWVTSLRESEVTMPDEFQRSIDMLRHVTAGLSKKSFNVRDEAESEAYDAMVIRIAEAKRKGLNIDIPNDGIELS
jgi:hypothetical protein